MAKPIFYDPERKRWKRLRRFLDVIVLAASLLIVFFIFTVFRGVPLAQLLLPQQRRPYKALKEKERRHPRAQRAARKSKKPASQLVLNSGDGVRAAFYVTWDAASFSSLREYLPQIDLLYPEWLHMLTPDGHLQAVTAENKLFNVVQEGVVRPVDDKVMPFLKAENAETEVLPLVNNFDPTVSPNGVWVTDLQGFFNDPIARANFRQQVGAFLGSGRYRGLTLDFEGFPPSAQAGFQTLVSELYSDLHAHGMKLHIAVPVSDNDYDYRFLAAHSDALLLMNYDEHYQGGDPGPVASQAWFTRNLENALKVVPKEKIVCAIGNYGYDWSIIKQGRKTVASATSVSAQQAWLTASESEAEVEYDPDHLNPHYAYLDGEVRHDVWFLDGATALNQMRAATKLGINTFALWRLGSEDRSLWPVWDLPGKVGVAQELRLVPPGQEVDMEGEGEILRITQRPLPGERSFTLDPATGLVTQEKYISLPRPYTINQYGANPNRIAITFDDGPDPAWTPQILDVLKQENAKATFFLIGLQAEKYPALAERIYAEGHEIGNHTFTHPDISNIRPAYMRVELNLAERLFASRLGVKPVLFRPPYSIDQEPDTADQVKPLEIAQDMGYITVGDKIDPNDWKENPRPTAEQITAAVMAHLPPCQPSDLRCGNIVLLHDGGGNRQETVRALPMIIRGLRARGYQIVTVAQLMGKPYEEVMVPISANERWTARVDRLGFWLFGLVNSGIVLIFFLGDILMSGRLFFVGALAIFDRFRRQTRAQGREQVAAGFLPDVAVIIPAYNEEIVIERTVRAALDSDYPGKLRVIVVDDGSTDRTLAVAQATFQPEITAGRVLVLTKPNSGKAEALNYAFAFVQEEVFVGIDADTVIAPDAISRLVPHFLDARLGAIAGNAKVGNRVNLWTRWQALEYVTSQNFERRALNVFGAVSVVPGAIGAWRTSAVREAGGFHLDTVAEDADLTMALLERGYRVEYEDRALAYTEAPVNANGLMRQRFRWSFGILQSVWKHGRAFGRKGALGWIALPNIVIFQILLPLVSPFIDIMFVMGTVNYLVDRYFHPLTADPASFEKLVGFFLAFMVIDFLASTLAFALERRQAGTQEDVWLLAHVWLQRFAYRQLFSVVLLKTLFRAMTGRAFAWDKLERTAAMPYARVGS
jgi:cellulose synthase/poly-beta-1,6-N-acetylglucosamine synthase-like glycosyltransferase/peptidoglycan/xylan/chitin deacetylase (PgdA/CDA1 family)/spore germination protein YaaH